MTTMEQYHARAEQTIASLKAWTGFVADVARVEELRQGDDWRMRLTPRAPAACPVEVVVRGDDTFGLTIAGVSCQVQPVAGSSGLLQILEAVTEGRVLTRRTSRAATGLIESVQTVVLLPGGQAIELAPTAQRSTDARELPEATLEARDTHYLPYRRPGR